MSIVSPNDSTEILYGSSGDVRNEINAWSPPTFSGHYIDENEVPGSSIIRAMERASRLINSYLEATYQDQIPVLSVAGVPKIFEDIGTDIACYYVWRLNTARLGKVPDAKKSEYYDAYTAEGGAGPMGGPVAGKGILAKLRDREQGIAEFTSNYPSPVVSSRDVTRTPIFDLDADTSQQIDPNLQDDIESERNN